ncbi:hypothetical protein AB0F52_09150 [Amycolatopsis sp. NPDC024027]|uniref:hypothetical protein n=1 Tax=Amycolatopsis sp. NPDC024027 TaxID=3154327 RepID=UPI0033FC8A71
MADTRTHAMTAQPAHEDATTSAPRCWCCGAERHDDELVHLGNHPDVAVCVGCDRWLHRGAIQLEDALLAVLEVWRPPVSAVAPAKYDEDYLHFFVAPDGVSELAGHGPAVPAARPALLS